LAEKTGLAVAQTDESALKNHKAQKPFRSRRRVFQQHQPILTVFDGATNGRNFLLGSKL
jgi:hypothetical protein